MSETARALARYTMTAANLAPGLYNPASAMDQVLENIQRGLSAKVTQRARTIMASGVAPKAALEEALTECYSELRFPPSTLGEVWQWTEQGRYPAFPGQYVPGIYRRRQGTGELGSLGTNGTSTATAGAAAAPTNPTAQMLTAIFGGVTALTTGIGTIVNTAIGQRRERDQQQYENRMAELNAQRRAAEEAALRESQSILPVSSTGGGLSGSTLLLGALGLAVAGGAIYMISRKKKS